MRDIIIWKFIGFIDTLIKAFQYGSVLLIPIILIIIFLIIKCVKLKRDLKNKCIVKKLSIIVILLITFVIIMICTTRSWGPAFYKHIIGISINNKELQLEKKLEKKYDRNFTFVSKSKINMDPHAGNTVDGDINNDYSVTYRFIDDDGVYASVEHKKTISTDYYEIKRSKYEIEKAIYDYAKQIDFNSKFFVFVNSRFESIEGADLDRKSSNNYIEELNEHVKIRFILTEVSEKNREFIIDALKNVFDKEAYVMIAEYVVTEEEYKKTVESYNSDIVKNGIYGKDYDELYDFDDIYYDYYYLY